MRFDVKEIFGDEVLDLFIATHHQPQHRRLYATNRQHSLIAGITPENGVGAGHVDAIQPVGASAGQRRHAQRDKLAIRAQAVNRPLNRLWVEVVNQATLHLLALFRRQLQVVQHLIDQQLPFSIRVARVNHFLRLAKQALDDVQLFGDRRFWLQLPLFRNDR